jgi:peptidyl-prolyl cis-trans isomerase SurA
MQFFRSFVATCVGAGVSAAPLAALLGFAVCGLSGCSTSTVQDMFPNLSKTLAAQIGEPPPAPPPPPAPVSQSAASASSSSAAISAASTTAVSDGSVGSARPVAMETMPRIEAQTSGPVVGKVVASVDGEPITMHEVEQFAAQAGSPIPPGEYATSPVAKKILKAIIDQRLIDQEVKKYDDKVDEGQVDKYIAELRQDKHMSEADFRAQVQASGMTYQEVRKQARVNLEKAMMIQQQVREKIEIPNSAIQAFYDSHKSDFTVEKERLKLAQILITIPPNATPAQIAAAQKKADQVRARALKGDDFNDLAHVYSDDDSKTNGGELGWFEPSDVMDEVLVGVKGLKPGQISPVIRTKHGFHIVKLEEHEMPGLVPLAEVKDRIRSKLLDDQFQSRLETWVESDLAKQHYIEIMN